MALTLVEKELVAVGISVAAGCKPCTSYHMQQVRKAEASDAEIRQAISQAARVRGDATQIMQAYGLARLGSLSEAGGSRAEDRTSRIQELVSVGAAFAVNCTSGLEAHLKAGRQAGIAEEEIREVVGLATFIKKMAASHVEKLVGGPEAGETAREQPDATAGCGCGC